MRSLNRGCNRKLVGKQAELEFITAPNIIPSNNPEEQVESNFLLRFKKM